MNLKHEQAVVYVFTNDLRLNDNRLFTQAYAKAATQQTPLLCLFCLPSWHFPLTTTGDAAMGRRRFQFLLQALKDLRHQLKSMRLSLVIRLDSIESVLAELKAEFTVSDVYRNEIAGFYEQVEWLTINQANPNIVFHTDFLNNLFRPADLPFDISELPKHFTPFRKQVEAIIIRKPQVFNPFKSELSDDGFLNDTDQWSQLNVVQESTGSNFFGGEQVAIKHLRDYFSGQAPSTYKQVRNHMLGWENSTKFSPWLALGCVSPLQIMQALRQYEAEKGANDSTYWIFFELLWREFFYWNAIKQGTQLFNSDTQPNRADTDQESFKRWAQGQTDEPLIDACMNELKATGYLSNRGRQIAASYLIHELNLDWRMGAAYFEKMLLDYDVASNWGNWQYIAGVGADPRGGRHFNVEKQQQIHDPKGRFRKLWSTHQTDESDVLWSQLVNS